ncbi:MAG: hypothetical protein Q9210_003655 [Variospora velana]
MLPLYQPCWRCEVLGLQVCCLHQRAGGGYADRTFSAQEVREVYAVIAPGSVSSLHPTSLGLYGDSIVDGNHCITTWKLHFKVLSLSPISTLSNRTTGILHVVPGLFRIQHDSGGDYLLKFAFEHTAPQLVESETMMDLDPTVDFRHRSEESRSLLLQFLDQFEEIDARWQHWYEPISCKVISRCAQYQKEILNREPTKSVDEFDQSTLLAALLRCLVIIHQLAEVDGRNSNLWPVGDSTVHVFLYEGVDEYWGLGPLITVQKQARMTSPRAVLPIGRRLRGLPMTLQKAIATMQCVMFRRRPQDLPYLLYSLCLLALIRASLQPSALFLTPILEAGDEIEEILRTLCKLYLFCSDDIHPLTEHVDPTKYAEMVNNDPVAVQHFDILNRLWKEAGKLAKIYGLTVPHHSAYHRQISRPIQCWKISTTGSIALLTMMSSFEIEECQRPRSFVDLTL